MTKRSDPEEKEKEIAERTAPPGDVVYQAIYDEGEHELKRGSSALALSGFAAVFRWVFRSSPKLCCARICRRRSGRRS